jgi:rhodanese-related sulfurtransferase
MSRVWWSDLAWAAYLLVVAAFFGLLQHGRLAGLGWRGELAGHLAKVRQDQRQIRFQGIRTINLSQAKALWQDKRALFVDARSSEEFAELHIEGAISLPPDRWAAIDAQGLPGVPLDRPLVIYCSQEACNAALQVAEKLQAKGYEQVMAYLGGFHAWDEAGLPVGTGPPETQAGPP